MNEPTGATGHALYTDEKFPLFTGQEPLEERFQELYDFLFRYIERQNYNAEHTATQKWVRDGFVAKE